MRKEKEPGIQERLTILIKARYPIIYLVTHEEKRAMEMLKSIAEERDKKLEVWSLSKGWGNGDGDPGEALDHILNVEGVSSGLFCLLDFDKFLENPMIIRKLRDAFNKLKNTFSSIIIISPVLKIPQHLEKEITVVDFLLPGQVELMGLLEGIIKQLNGDCRKDINDTGKDAMVRSAMGLTLPEAENAFARSIVENNGLDEKNPALVLKEKEQEIRKSGFLEFYPAKDQIKDIGGMDELKTWLVRRGKAFSKEAETFGLPQPRGVLLLGVQGCGKSLTAKASANLWGLPLLRLDVGKIFASLVGESESNVRKAIKTAEALSPCILWIDEIEKAFAGSKGSTDSGVSARVFGTILTWLQEKEKPVFVVATANDISSLPPELLRKGRLDEIFFVDLPSRDSREEILKIHILKRNRNPENFNLKEVLNSTDGFSGAELEEIVISGLFTAFDEGIELDTKHLIKSAQETKPLSETAKEHIDGLRKWAKGRTRFAEKVNGISTGRKIEVN